MEPSLGTAAAVRVSWLACSVPWDAENIMTHTEHPGPCTRLLTRQQGLQQDLWSQVWKQLQKHNRAGQRAEREVRETLLDLAVCAQAAAVAQVDFVQDSPLFCLPPAASV